MVITDIEQLTPDWMTQALQRHGLSGEITAVETEHLHGTWSKMYRIRPSYSVSNPDLPESFLLKICSGEHAVFGPSEVYYYTMDYANLPDAPIPRCYDGVYQSEPRGYHLLVEDLSATHKDTWEMPPTLERGKAVAEALARLHAHYWGPDRIESIGEKIPGALEIGRYVGHNKQGLHPLFDTMGDALPPDWRQVLEDVFAYHPAAMLARTRRPAGFTIVHGDVNSGNILAPIDGGDGRIYLIDRQPFDWSLTCWLGAADLAYMMVEWWDTEMRREHEMTVLRHYQSCLEALGAEYPWGLLVNDYRLSAVKSLQGAVEWCVLEEDRNDKRWVWEPKLHKAMAAYFDLDCAEIMQIR
ncbi:MAG: phosphotransferase [Candidatus Promineifilaceae bacterium]